MTKALPIKTCAPEFCLNFVCLDRDLFRDPSILEGYGGDSFRQVLGHLPGQPAPRVHGQGEPNADPTPRYTIALATNHINKTLLNFLLHCWRNACNLYLLCVDFQRLAQRRSSTR